MTMTRFFALEVVSFSRSDDDNRPDNGKYGNDKAKYCCYSRETHDTADSRCRSLINECRKIDNDLLIDDNVLEVLRTMAKSTNLDLKQCGFLSYSGNNETTEIPHTSGGTE